MSKPTGAMASELEAEACDGWRLSWWPAHSQVRAVLMDAWAELREAEPSHSSAGRLVRLNAWQLPTQKALTYFLIATTVSSLISGGKFVDSSKFEFHSTMCPSGSQFTHLCTGSCNGLGPQDGFFLGGLNEIMSGKNLAQCLTCMKTSAYNEVVLGCLVIHQVIKGIF